YDFLVPKEQVASGGDKPWSRVSPHLWVTGNTYVVVHPDTQACLVVDPWGQQSIDQLAKLRAEKKLGPIERVLITHAHFDHFDGVYLLPNRPQYHLSTLDQVAGPLKDPRRFRAPFLDSRPIRFDLEYTDGARFDWGGQTWTVRHQPGQTVYTASFQTTIDSKRVLFTADNFFHHEQFSGTGGWMGLNRSFPGAYAESAQAVLDAKPDWILAEHGGPFEFNAADFRRRVAWGRESANAANKLCASGDHRQDWNPHTTRIEPFHLNGQPGERLTLQVFRAEHREALHWEIPNNTPRGRLVVRLATITGKVTDSQTDAFIVIDVD
ncbi:MAG: MBL fold metallo-hydrolase, partial [Gemmataceae bacterium]